jgi:hypothetical protein
MQIDLKNCEVYFIDGFGDTGAVNLMAGYSSGATTMAVDGITGAIPDGVTFLVAGDDVVHVVTSASETLGNTTSLTFSPALGASVVDDAAITFGGRQLKIKIGEGTISYDEKRAIEYKKDRGRLDTVRLGDEEPMDVKFDIRWDFLKSDTSDPPTPEEVLKKIGNASDWESSSSDACEPYAIDIYIVHTPPCVASASIKAETYLFQDFRYESLSHDFKQGMLACSGKCNRTMATVARV